MALVLAVVNQKGGVGKTTTAVNLGAALAAKELPTLVVDVDPQSNATRSLGFDRNIRGTVYDVLVGRLKVQDVIRATGVQGLQLVPASPDLAGAEVELVGLERREGRLEEALAPVTGEFRVVLLDCPPSLGLLSVNALVAADGVIVPVQCEYLSLEGLGQLVRTLELVRNRLNPRLALAGVVMTMFDPRTRLSAEVVADVGRHFPGIRFDTIIPRSVRLSEAPSHGLPIQAYAPESAGARAYGELAEELAHRFSLPSRGAAVQPLAVSA